MEVFDIFVRRYETNEPLITLTVSPVHTVGKIKKMFAENCMLIKTYIRYLTIDSDFFYPEKQQIWYNGTPLKRENLFLRDYDVKAGSTIYIQDKGI